MAASSSTQRLKGILAVTVLKATNLIKSDWFSENDCYAVVSIEPLTVQKKILASDKKEQTEAYQRTQIHDGCNPIFNEKLLFPVPDNLETLYVQLWDSDCDKDDLLGYGNLSLLDDEQGGLYDMNLNKQWLHTVSVPLLTETGKDGGTLELLLCFIPETTAAYMNKKFDAAQAEVKKKIMQRVISQVTGAATEKLKGYAGVDV